MERNIPVPAESLRTLAENSQSDARRLRDEGKPHSARRLERNIGQAFSRLEAKHGEFVSVPASTVSSLASSAEYGESNVDRHREAAKVFLKQYDIWS